MIHIRSLLVSVLFLFSFSVLSIAQNNSFDSTVIFHPKSALKLVSRQFSFTEGPAVDKKGNIYFTDQPNNKIWKYTNTGHLEVFKEDAGRSNGMYFDSENKLITCADEHNELWQIDRHGNVKVLLKDFKGIKFNGPNDVWTDRSRGIYFTDPYYQRDYWVRKQPDMEKQRVYYLCYGADSAKIATDDVKQPNGIVGTPDGKVLYIADFGQGKTFKYSIAADGSLFDRQVFANMASDGMTIDDKGNVYLTGKGVTVFNSSGHQIAHISVPEKWTANVCFGGKRKDLLFITASEGIYIRKMAVKGVE
ncbi:SMP-30/gluconolactonase/LRE family protein [Desertivirga arenae]|uniref:SMP-30/gluconolactonase/LRE family protein n=1 Tax=Desertivirga arenae TaxID=2810309 RepID=UPI001A95A331|nr:SMP-30/gluconolactonase/LRE family protein [Pedobacter sp. SYSU D00823]